MISTMHVGRDIYFFFRVYTSSYLLVIVHFLLVKSYPGAEFSDCMDRKKQGTKGKKIQERLVSSINVTVMPQIAGDAVQ